MVLSREKILVVASDPTVLDIITRQALAAAGFATSTAKDFSTAMEAVTAFQPDAQWQRANESGSHWGNRHTAEVGSTFHDK